MNEDYLSRLARVHREIKAFRRARRNGKLAFPRFTELEEVMAAIIQGGVKSLHEAYAIADKLVPTSKRPRTKSAIRKLIAEAKKR